MMERFERQVDPDGVLTPAERARRAGHARKAYFARLALRSAQARRKTSAVVEEDCSASMLDEHRAHAVELSSDGFSPDKVAFDAKTSQDEKGPR